MKKSFIKPIVLVLIVILLFGISVVSATPVVSDLTTESVTNGTQIITNVTVPHFEWMYNDDGNTTQHSYNVHVGSTSGASDLWDSGTVSNVTGQNTFTTYAGSTLSRGVTYYVAVRAYNSTVWSAWINGTFKFNQLPVISGVETTYSVDEGDLLSIDVDATDGDDDTLTFSCDRTDLFTFDTSTGVATWTPDYTEGGTYTIGFGVSDTLETDNETTVITVAQVLVSVRAVGPVDGVSSDVDDVAVSTQPTVLTGLDKVFADISNFFSGIFNLFF
ncbi:MAG: hypothetical protein KAS04_01085 [Candidatus Aenigmarchaeota archaeon]|nr:hypothetical protein [Candidatus Aenigmarchaeota archaeon]